MFGRSQSSLGFVKKTSRVFFFEKINGGKVKSSEKSGYIMNYMILQ